MGKVLYYISVRGENPVLEFLNSLEVNQRAKVRKIFLTIQTYGLVSVVPHIKKISGTPLWEIRILGADNIRVIYVTQSRDDIIVLHGFMKKTQKTLQRDLSLALKRYSELRKILS